MSSHPVVLGLDLSKRRTGFAVGSCDWTRFYWGTYSDAGDWEKQSGKRLHAWRNWLKEKIAQHGVTYIAMERLIIPKNEFNYESHIPMAQIHGITDELALDLGIRCGSVHISTWRAHGLGTSVAPKHLGSAQRTNWFKDEAVRKCMQRGWLTSVHDEAEALLIMDFALYCLDEDYAHKIGPFIRRAELKASEARYRGEAPAA